MIAVVLNENGEDPCVVYWTGRKGLSVKVRAWCGGTFDASDGVIQLPDSAKVCEGCTHAIKSGKPNL